MASLWQLFVSIQGENSGFKKSLKDSQQDLTSFEKTASSVTDKIGNALLALGPKLSAVGIAAFILKTGEAFEQAQAKISRATGETGKTLEGLNENFRHLYAASGKSADEVAEGLSKVRIETKLQGEALESLTMANLRFAKVTDSSVGAVVEQTQVLFQNWGIATRDQEHALDILYSAMTDAGIGMGDLSGQMTELGPVARQFGLSFVQTAALVESFDDAGLKASDVVKGLSTLFGKFRAAGKDPIEAFSALVEKLRDTETRAAALTELLDSGLKPAIAIKIVDAAQRGGFALDGYIKKLLDSNGKVAEVAKNSSTLTEELSKLWHNVEEGVAGPGSRLTSWLRDIVKQGNELAAKGGIAAIFGGGWAAGKIASKDAGWTISQGSVSGEPDTTTAPPSRTGSGSAGAPKATSHSFTIAESMAFDQLQKSVERTKQRLAEFYGAGVDGAKKLDYAVSSNKDNVLDFSVAADAAMVDFAHTVDLPAKSFAEALSPAIRESEAAMHSLGIASTRELRAQYDAAMAAAQAMIENGAGVADVGAAMERVAEAHAKLSKRTTDWTKATVAARVEMNEFQKQISRTFDRLSRGIADSIINWKGFGSTLKDIAKDTASSFLEIMIRQLIKPLEGEFAKLAGALGKALGIGGSAASGAAGAAGSAVSGAGSAAGGASGAVSGAASGVMGTIGAVSAAVGAVSSVVSNFQLAGVNKSLDVLVNHTLRIYNELANFRTDAWTREGHWYTRTSDIWQTLLDIKDAIGRGGAGGKGGINFNNCSFTGSPNEIASAIFTQAQLAGAI